MELKNLIGFAWGIYADCTTGDRQSRLNAVDTHIKIAKASADYLASVIMLQMKTDTEQQRIMTIIEERQNEADVLAKYRHTI